MSMCWKCLEVLVFEERGKLEYPEKNLSEQGREPTTNSTHIWHWCRDLNVGPDWWEASAFTTAPPLLPKHIFLILGVSTETFTPKWNLANAHKRKKNEGSWTFKSANKLVLATWHTGLHLCFRLSLIQSLALKQWHKTRWNDDKWHNVELGLNT